EEAKKVISDPKIEVILYKKNRFKKLVEILEDHNFKSPCIEGTHMDHISYTKLENMLRKKGNRLIARHGLVEDLRIIKDSSEIKDIKKACKITDNAFQDFLRLPSKEILKLNELEIAIELEKLLIQNGGKGRSFDFVIAGGRNSSMPHHGPDCLNINDSILLMDFGTFFNNYCSDITRTVFLGRSRLNDRLKKIYEIVLSAQVKALEACKEGVSCSKLDSVAREYIREHGFEKQFGHGLGHGVGLEVHEAPTVNQNSWTILKENMIITIEPGIYIPGLGGIRIEDMVIVKKNGCEILYRSKKDFTILQ
ncbi:MAG: M24 family metallopeptidase, partial [Actinobacteria bacterium]|nr:M24 family metallopeptidase [Actinomycetota bacterium]